MRRGIALLGAAAALILPGAAFAFSGTYTGDFAGDTSPESSLHFTARVHFSKKGKFVPTKVRNFKAAVQFSCFDAGGGMVSSTRRDDLARGFFSGLKVNKHRRFGGTSPTPTGFIYTVSGRLGGKGRANGSMQITQGEKGLDGYCSTGTFADPTVRWTAIFLPNKCCAQPEVVRAIAASRSFGRPLAAD